MTKQFKPLLDRVKDVKTPELIKPTPGKIRELSAHTEKPRSTPKGTVLIKQEKDEAILKIRYVLRFWWPFLPAMLALFTLFGAAPAGTLIGGLLSDWQTNRIPTTIFVFVVGSLIATAFAVQKTRGEITVIAQKDKIKVGNRVYDRQHYSGMRIGYSTEDGAEVLKNDFFDLSGGSTALRLTYGRWGEDLPYLVNKYHAPEIVIWMNELIDGVGRPDPGPNDATQGRREQNF